MRTLIGKLPHGQKILDAIDKLSELKEQYDTIKDTFDNVNAYVSTDSVEQFEAAYSIFESSLDFDKSDDAGLFDIFGGLFSGLFGAGTSTDTTEIADSLSSGKTLYITSDGDLSTKKKNATASIKESAKLTTYNTLKKDAQEFTFGTSDDTKNWKIKTLGGNDTITSASSANVTIDSGKGNDNILVSGDGNAYVKGGAGNDSIAGNTGNDKLLGGAGADTLSGGSGNDTLTGGAGRDVFIYESGNDIITDYKAGQDKIHIDGNIDSVTVKGKNVIFNIGDGQLTVKGGKSKKITLVDEDGNTISNNKYTKSTKAANFVEESDADSDYWFANDDTFTTSDMDSIVKVDDADYSVGKLDTYNVLTDLTQNKQPISNIVYNKTNK